MPEGGGLDGVTVVVTRPAHQADELCRSIEAAGGTALRFPVIDIRPMTGDARLEAVLQRLPDYDLAIFISANAVRYAYAALGNRRLPDGLRRAAVGRATAKALAAQGQPAQLLAPEPYNSEALLTLPELASLQGRRVVIFRGGSGRDLLADTLRERAARVDYAEVYRRLPAGTDPIRLYQAWERHRLDLIVVTSNEGLQNLFNMVNVEHRQRLLSTPLVVIGARTAALARDLGFTAPVTVARTASDAALLDAIEGRYPSRHEEV